MLRTRPTSGNVRLPAAIPAAPSTFHGLVYRKDDAGAAPIAPVGFGPVDEHDQPVAEADQEIDVRREPYPPGDDSGDAQAAEVGDGGHAADGGERAEVPVAEWADCAAGELGENGRRRIAPHLLRSRRDRRHGAGGVWYGRQIADNEDVRMLGDGELRSHQYPSSTVDGDTQRRSER